jgi:hypothetical protein
LPGRRPRKLLLSLACVLCCAALAPALASAAGTSTIFGTVFINAGMETRPAGSTRVCIVNQTTSEEACVEGNQQGQYEFTELEAGEYAVNFTGIVCSNDECVQAFIPQTENTTVREGEAVVVHAALIPYGSIKGTVTEAGSGTPIVGMKVEYEGLNGEGDGVGYTDIHGGYFFRGLKAGEYKVTFSGQICTGGTCRQTYAERIWNEVKPQNPPTPVAISDDVAVEGVDAALELLGAISGQVTDSHGDPIANTMVCTNSQTEFYNDCVFTDAGGEYELPHLPPGEFNVQFTGRICPTAGGCEREACEEGNACTQPYLAWYWSHEIADEAADLVTVTAGQTHGEIDETLAPAGQIKGKVTVAALGAPPLAGFVVCGSGQTTPAVGYCTTTDANGEYTLEGLGTSDWMVEFKEACAEEPCPGAYETQFYDGKAEEGEATLVALTAPEVKTSINASIKELAPQVPAFTADPVATGVPVVGHKLSCSEGTWTGNPTAIRYAWLRDGVPIVGAEANEYAATSADENEDVTCEVEISNSAGSKKAISNNVHVGPEVAPVFFIEPSLLGTAAVGSTLECIEGAANNYPTSTTYAWLRDGTVIAGQGGSTYNVTAADEGALITCQVTMSNGAGAATAGTNGLTIPKHEEAKHEEETKHEEEAKPTNNGSSSAGSSTTPPATVTVPAQVPPPGTVAATGNKASSGRSVSITLTCSGKAACQGSLKLTAKRKGKTITIGTASFNIAVGASRAVAVKLNSKGEKMVKEAGKKGLKVQLSGTNVKPRTLTVH